MENRCTLYLVRHGETEGNRDAITMGQLDSPLTAAGVEQAQLTGEELKDIHFDVVFASDLPRAIRTAEIVMLDRTLAVETREALRERNYGNFEGKPSADFKKAIADLMEQKKIMSRKDRWDYSFGDGFESDEELSERFIIQLREIAVAYPEKTVLVVSHGGCLRTFLMKVGWAEHLESGSFQNGGYIKVISDGVNFAVEKVEGIKAPGGAE